MLTVEPLFCSSLPETLRDDWQRLWAAAPPPSFQSEFEWMAAWAAHVREDWNPLLLLARDGRDLMGILPLMYRDDRRRGVVPFRRVRFLGANATDFSTVLAAPEHTDAVVQATLSWLCSGAWRWEELVLDDLPEGSPSTAAIAAFLAAAQVSGRTVEGRYYFVDLTAGWQAVWAAVSKSYVRRNLNLATNRLNRAGAWSVVADPDWTAKALVDAAAPIHAARQRSLERPSRYGDEAYRAFVRSVIEHNLARGRFRSHWLVLEDRPIAFLFGFEQAGTYYAWNMAFDPAAAEFYPTRLLFGHVIRECHDRGLNEFNMMRGEAEYKEKWTKTHRGNLRFIAVNRRHFYGRILDMLERVA